MNKVIHWVVSLVLFGVPLIVATHSPLLDVTIGAIWNGIYLWASHKVNPTAPLQ